MQPYPRSGSFGPASYRFHGRRLERRQGRRSPYVAQVRVEAEMAHGIDISPLGLAVEMTDSVQIGDIVRVALSPRSKDGAVAEIAASARVVRVHQTSRGVVVALLFLESASD